MTVQLRRIEAGFYEARLASGGEVYTVANMAGQSVRWRGEVDTWVIRRGKDEVARRRTLAEARAWLSGRADPSQRPQGRCEERARQGTGYGTCNRLLSHGQCDRAAEHA